MPAILEDEVPPAPPGKRFTRQMRIDCLKARQKLPPAWRVPTERSLNFFLQSVLCEEALLDVLTNYRDNNKRTMDSIIAIVTNQLLPNIPQQRRKLVKDVVRNSLRKGKGGAYYYTLEATAKRLRGKDYEDCCARDHYMSDSYGKRFHAFVLYRFVLFMQTKSDQLRAATSETTAVCAVCQHRAARRASEGGEQVLWRQAEPCRCWTCDACTTELFRQGLQDHCSFCRREVFTYAKGVAPAANQA